MLADLKGARLAAAVFLHLGYVLRSGDPHQLFKRTDDLLLLDLMVGGRDQSALDAAGGFDDHSLIGFYRDSAGIKVVDLAPVLKFDSDYLCHCNTLSIRRARRYLKSSRPQRAGKAFLRRSVSGTPTAPAGRRPPLKAAGRRRSG